MATVEDARAHNDVAPVNIITNGNMESAIEDVDTENVFSDDVGGATLERKLTNYEHASVPKPGDVRINVKGAFIVEDDEEPGTPEEDFDTEGYQLERRGIRLPNHKAVVSHIAVDVCFTLHFRHPHTNVRILGELICEINRSVDLSQNWCISPLSRVTKRAGG